jgi:tetratricopeptide (TPR) repeat protein
VEKFIGDAVMAVFGVPHVHEDDAVRALRAASDLRAALAALNEELARERDLEIHVRAGVNTGEVVADGGGNPQTLVTGDAVNVAKRLEEAARAGEILVGSATERLARNAATFELLGPLELKGKAGGVEAWRLVEIVPATALAAPQGDTPLVGRAAELDRLHAELDRAIDERACKRFTLIGAAGIGKSRLAREFLGVLSADATVLSGRCLPYGEGITFWPLHEIIRELGGEKALMRLLADDEDAALVCERLTGTAGSHETFWAVRRLCETLARTRPLVLCFEDVHWAEPMLLDLIEYLVGWIRDAPVLLLCLARPDFTEHRPGWIAADGSGSSWSLRPLDGSEINQLLDELSIAGGARKSIAEAAEGNPLYVEQMAAMVAEGFDDDATFTAPPTIQALLAARLDRLSGGERAAIERAAVIGKEFSRSAVTDLTAADVQSQVGTHLMSLVRKDLIRPHRSALPADDGFRFAHVLVRDAAYVAVPKQTRADLHARFADWLVQNASGLETELEEIIGYHLEHAFRYRAQLGPVDEDAQSLARRASDFLGKAGRRAFGRDDVNAAVNLLDRAVSLATEQTPAVNELRRELSLALWSLGEVARAEALLAGVIETATLHGQTHLQWYSLLDRAGHRAMIDPDRSRDEALDVAKKALRVFEELADDLGQAHAHREICAYRQSRGQFGAAADAAERALRHARRAGDRRLEARSGDSLCTCLLYGPAAAQEAIRVCRDLLGDARGKPLLEANVLASLAGLEAMQGAFEAARGHVARAELIYGELGLRLADAGLRQISASVELLAGEPQRAEEILLPALELLESIGAHGYTGVLLAEALLAQQRHDESAEILTTIDEAVSPSDVGPFALLHSLRARLAARDGDSDAVEEARDAVARAKTTDALNLQAETTAGLADVLHVLRRSDEAARTLEAAIAVYERKGNTVAARRCRSLLPALAGG